ncbi:MAG: hypothetical protein AMXMBFR26_06870 [Porticoccaceae bacterium]
MEGFAELLSVVSAGSDAATVALVVMVYRLQVRMMRLEFKIFGFGERAEGGG